MATVPESELKQKTSEYLAFVRDFAMNASKDVIIKDKRDGYNFYLQDKDVTLEFSI